MAGGPGQVWLPKPLLRWKGRATSPKPRQAWDPSPFLAGLAERPRCGLFPRRWRFPPGPPCAALRAAAVRHHWAFLAEASLATARPAWFRPRSAVLAEVGRVEKVALNWPSTGLVGEELHTWVKPGGKRAVVSQALGALGRLQELQCRAPIRPRPAGVAYTWAERGIELPTDPDQRRAATRAPPLGRRPRPQARTGPRNARAVPTSETGWVENGRKWVAFEKTSAAPWDTARLAVPRKCLKNHSQSVLTKPKTVQKTCRKRKNRSQSRPNSPKCVE